MKLGSLVLTFLVALPSARAQIPAKSHGEAYAIAAPLAQPSFSGRATYVAAGGEVFVLRGLTMGAEVGPVITHSRTAGTYAFGLGSANVAYHFSKESKGMDPFLTAGYSSTFRAGIANGANLGLGVNFWQKKNLAVRFEFRAYLGRLRIDQVGPRVGVTFR